MLMTRLVYLSFTLLILAINGAALWTALTRKLWNTPPESRCATVTNSTI